MLTQSVVINVSTNAAQQNLSSLTSSLNNTSGASSALTGTLGKLAGAIGLTFGASESIRQVVDFENAIAGVAAVSRASADDLAQLTEQARLLGATTSFGAEQAAGAQRFLAQAGLEVNEVLSATPTLLDLAKAGQLDLAESADIATNVLSGFRLEVSELTNVADVLAETAASSNTNIQQLGQALSFAAPLAAAAGVSIEETAAVIGVLSDNGLQASRAGTGFVGILRQLSKITPDAQKALASYGVSLKDVDITTRGIQPVLETLRDANIGVTDSFTIFQTEAAVAAQALLASADGVDALTSKLDEAGGAAKKASDILGNTLGDSLKGLSSAISESILQVGSHDTGLNGAFRSLIDTTTGVIQSYNGMLDIFAESKNLSAEQVENIELISDGLTALSVVITGRVIGSLATMTSSFVAAQLAATSAAGAIGVLKGALALLGGPAGLFAIAAVGTGVWIKGLNDSETAARNAKEETNRFIESLENASVLQFTNNIANATDKLNKAERALASVEKQLSLATSGSSLAIALESRLAPLEEELRVAADELTLIEASFIGAAQAAQDYAKSTDKVNESTPVSTITSTTSAIKEQLTSYEELKARLDDVFNVEFQRSLLQKEIEKSSSTDTQKEELTALADAQRLESLKALNSQLKENESTAQDFFGAFSQGFKDNVDATESGYDAIRTAGSNAYDSLSQGLSDFITTGKLDVKSFAASVIADFAKIALQKSISGFAGSLFDGLGGGDSGSGGFLSSIFRFAQGGAFDGNVRAFAQGGVPSLSSFSNSVVSSPTMFAAGGTPNNLMGEAGAEAILPLTRTSTGNLGVEAITGGGGGNATVFSPTINITVESTGNKQDDQQAADANANALSKEVENLFSRLVLKEQRNGGIFNKTGFNR